MERNIKRNVYVCITESLCCTTEINTHCKSTVLQLEKGKKIPVALTNVF